MIVQDEITKNASSGSPVTTRHNHDGINSPRVFQGNLIKPMSGSGSITFSHTGDYILNLFPNSNPNPTLILCYGIVIDSAGFVFTVSPPASYRFTATPASASLGAVYTNNGHSFTVLKTIYASSDLLTSGTGAPTASGTLTLSSGAGDPIITFSSSSRVPNAVIGSVYTINGGLYTVLGSITGGVSLYTDGNVSPPDSGVLSLVSGSGDPNISYSLYTASTTVRAHTMGSAQLGQSYYFQPDTNSTVKEGGPVQSFIQSSTYFSTSNLGAVHALTDEGNLVDVEYSGIHARLTLIDYNNTSIVLRVPYLDSGWQIIVNIVVI